MGVSDLHFDTNGGRCPAGCFGQTNSDDSRNVVFVSVASMFLTGSANVS